MASAEQMAVFGFRSVFEPVLNPKSPKTTRWKYIKGKSQICGNRKYGEIKEENG